MSKSKLWLSCKVGVVILIILTFTPLMTPVGVHKPELAGMPYTLWVGIVNAFLLVSLTWIGTKVHPSNENINEN